MTDYDYEITQEKGKPFVIEDFDGASEEDYIAELVYFKVLMVLGEIKL